MNAPLRCLLIFASCALAAASPAAQSFRNVLTNADFEGPAFDTNWAAFSSIEGWTAETGAIELQTAAVGNAPAHGDHHLELDSLSTISQACSTKAGQDYSLSFAFSPRPGAPEMTFEVWFADTRLESIVVPVATSASWTYRSYRVSAVTAADELEFRDLTGGSVGVLIDDCALIPFDPSSTVELVRNRSFEDDLIAPPGGSMEWTTIEGWIPLPGTELEFQNTATTGQGYLGVQVLDLDEFSGVLQYIDQVAGEPHTLSFAASPNPAAGAEQSFEVVFGGEVVDTLTLPTTSEVDWQVYSYTVSEDDPTTTLEFRDLTGGGAGALLDAISLRGPEAEGEDDGHILSYSIIERNQSKGLFIGPNDMFARSVCCIGDLDGDGNDDLASGAIGDDDGDTNAGAVWILFLNADRTLKGSQKISQVRGNLQADLDRADGFGRSLTMLGDLDDDGVQDIAVGANRDDDGDTNAGAVHILFLNADGTVKNEHKISATSGDDLARIPGNQHEFGAAVSGLGDVDGDGIVDLAIGARRGEYVLICFMNRDGTVRASTEISYGVNGFTAPRPPSFGWFAMSTANIGDFDGDGINDLLIGTLTHRVGPDRTGALHMVLLENDGTVKDWAYYGPENVNPTNQYLTTFDEFSVALSSAGDVDGDGVTDLLVGGHREGRIWGPSHTRDRANRGATYVLFLNPNMSLKRTVRLADREGWDFQLSDFTRWGESMTPLGDLDGNGKVEVAIGSRFLYNTGALFICELEGGGTPAVSAGFSAAPLMGDSPLTVNFTNLSGGAESYSWDFGDGATSTESDPSHTYTSDGVYSVTLVAQNAGGDSDTTTKTDYVTVGEMPLTGLRPLGCEVNPAGSFVILDGTLQVGTTIRFGVDNPLGTQAIGSIPRVAVSWRVDANDPCGTLVANRNMAGPGIDGELLIGTAFQQLAGPAWQGPGMHAPVDFSLPNRMNLVGRKLYVQGRIVDTTPGASVPVGFAGAFEITIQP